MNDYKITDSIGDITVTAIDEKDARRTFKNFRKCGDGDIISVELIRENVPATKAQEREALEKIKAIVATLGPRSYVGTALDGCLVDAEVNIENDFGDSMKARWQDAEKRVAQVVQEAAEIRDKLQQEIREKQQAREEAQAAIREAERRAGILAARVITDADRTDLTDAIQVIGDKMTDIKERIKVAADSIVATAEEPESSDFIVAVKEHRDARGDLEYYTALVDRIKAIRGR